MFASRAAGMLALLLLAGCAGRVVTPMQPGTPDPAPDVPTRFSYTPSPVDPAVLNGPDRVDEHYRRSRLVFTAGDLDPDGEIGLHVDRLFHVALLFSSYLFVEIGRNEPLIVLNRNYHAPQAQPLGTQNTVKVILGFQVLGIHHRHEH